MKYKVVNTCFFKGRVWEQGEVVDMNEPLPRHFQPLEEARNVEKPVVRDIMAAVPYSIGQPIKPEGGMASKIDFDLPKPMETASTIAKTIPDPIVPEKIDTLDKVDRRTKAWKERNK